MCVYIYIIYVYISTGSGSGDELDSSEESGKDWDDLEEEAMKGFQQQQQQQR